MRDVDGDQAPEINRGSDHVDDAALELDAVVPEPGLAEAAFEDIDVPLGLVDDADLAGAAFEIIDHPEGAGDNIDDDYDDLADFTRAFEAPPLHNILDNAGESIEQVSEKHKAYIDTSKCICKQIRSRKHQPRLFETCYSTDVGYQLRTESKKLKGHMHEQRWGDGSLDGSAT